MKLDVNKIYERMKKEVIEHEHIDDVESRNDELMKIIADRFLLDLNNAIRIQSFVNYENKLNTYIEKNTEYLKSVKNIFKSYENNVNSLNEIINAENNISTHTFNNVLTFKEKT